MASKRQNIEESESDCKKQKLEEKESTHPFEDFINDVINEGKDGLVLFHPFRNNVLLDCVKAAQQLKRQGFTDFKIGLDRVIFKKEGEKKHKILFAPWGYPKLDISTETIVGTEATYAGRPLNITDLQNTTDALKENGIEKFRYLSMSTYELDKENQFKTEEERPLFENFFQCFGDLLKDNGSSKSGGRMEGCREFALENAILYFKCPKKCKIPKSTTIRSLREQGWIYKGYYLKYG
jgi:hypothetical protein